MALRTSKITSEIIQTCNRYFSSNAELSTNKLSATLNYNDDLSRPHRPFRYKIANLEKPQGLPQLTFHDEETPLFAELQPGADPEFRFDQAPQRWIESPSDNSPFPKSLKQISEARATTYSDKQKAEDKFVKFKMSSFMPISRNFSTVTSALTRQYSKGPAENSSEGNCKGKLSKCVKVKQKECKLGSNKHCPRLKIKDCKQSAGSKCERYYLNAHCVKKFAPYPSYSEACAEHLPDDPSECQQCPWRTCDDADSIEPGKPVRGKRHYSTCCHRHLKAMSGVVSPHLPSLSTIQEYICDRKCGKTKPPCKEPMGPCEVRKRKQEHDRADKTKRPGDSGSKKKKASDMEERMVLSSYIDGADQNNMIINPYTLEPVQISLNSPMPNKSSWIDIFDGPEAFLDGNKKPPYCDRKKKPKPPKRNAVDKPNPELIEYGDVEWWSGRGKKTVVTPPSEGGCKDNKCPNQEIRSKQGIYLSTPGMLLKNKGKKGDEGHPPPCPETKEKSKRCPKEPLKKHKYKKRPTNVPYYKKPEDPYNANE